MDAELITYLLKYEHDLILIETCTSSYFWFIFQSAITFVPWTSLARVEDKVCMSGGNHQPTSIQILYAPKTKNVLIVDYMGVYMNGWVVCEVIKYFHYSSYEYTYINTQRNTISVSKRSGSVN